MTKSLEAENYAAWFAGGRLSGQASYARERRYYGDPANVAKFERERGNSVKRDIDEVQNLLDMWADWMHRPEPIADGYPDKASGGFIESWRKDSEDAAAAADAETVERVNAAFDSLSPLYRDAILRHYNLGSRVWNFAKDCTFEDAKIVIRVKFVAKGLL
jgi:hypothetical protein